MHHQQGSAETEARELARLGGDVRLVYSYPLRYRGEREITTVYQTCRLDEWRQSLGRPVVAFTPKGSRLDARDVSTLEVVSA